METTAPWSLEGEAIVALALDRRSSGGGAPASLGPGATPPRRLARVPTPPPCGDRRPRLVIAARYTASPVGPYVELALGEPARTGTHLGLAVTTMVVDSAESEAAGRRNWGFPKQLGAVSWVVDGDKRGLEWEDGGVHVLVTARRWPSVPVLVPVRALQHQDGEDVVVPGRLRARARAGMVTVEAPAGGDFDGVRGTRPGLLLSDLRLVVRPAVAVAKA